MMFTAQVQMLGSSTTYIQHCSFQVLWRKELENINQDLVRQKINGVHLKKLALDESKTLVPVDIYRIYLK